ncbi:acetyl-CoA carboxylase biotin carboxyl carrier protein [Halalkalibacterium halodurans]|jgi:acetyl-CoA carboxylase biotin carboxyl carrier protein|uniref:Biotin carboxyl carrier protein of acetyl-CoA carboxylase n=2 Tax=Halalkalibacterium halodurans TaxID=86665 RepID=Q9K962_HALH5|nr:acetyl-CoA carboxylase biotin carboxyl carrier protein [Halalkalibacterium halodurans]MDY7223341.1 acetyl-CoA carboxylase biotin carboxyl carrier protein [Halalkalibacterium halodurans]MDY7242562.1 acetyl-CoA carboxylase biotin carboxyl carrier protein [Halalkalibacterium halodurans]MED4080224.1 acetyl-CoA carboxylase biotin carboxyl carrier protein [Halalkalibacterium halodurans]MED4084708.1 acetyl-CoA carboxylase biotin carboxyl carrier protein [Halalkalibacterium halodurans]MED4103912.1 
MLKVQEIRELIRAVDQSDLDEFKLEQEGLKLVLKKSQGETVAYQQPVQSAPVPAPVVQAVQEPPKGQAVQAAPASEPVKEEAETKATDNLHKITSPMVGTFYVAPSPDSDPYVKVGDNVSENTVVCIVEAMKLMNEIEAEVKGKIVEVLAENGELVEYGQPLFVVEPQK